MMPGPHMFKFQCQLPESLPSSYESASGLNGQYGHVRYFCKAVMERSSIYNKECKAAFTVIRPLDLNVYEFQHLQVCCVLI